MKIENQNELTKAELTLAIPEELLEKAKNYTTERIARN